MKNSIPQYTWTVLNRLFHSYTLGIVTNRWEMKGRWGLVDYILKCSTLSRNNIFILSKTEIEFVLFQCKFNDLKIARAHPRQYMVLIENLRFLFVLYGNGIVRASSP